MAALALGGAAPAERAILECVADTWIARGGRSPHGADRVLALTPRGAAALSFRTAAARGWRVQQAVLLLHLAGGTAPRRIRVAAIGKPWSESAGVWNTIPRPGGSWRRVRTFEENWIALDLSPAEAAAPGILLSGAEARFDSRESAGFAPYLMVEGSPRPGAAR